MVVHVAGSVSAGPASGRPRPKLFSVASIAVLVVAVVAVGFAAALLARVMTAAQSINEKAAVIATTGRGINAATDTVIQLTRTNEIATSILQSAKPLEGTLTDIRNSAAAIDELAASINASAGAINATAGEINTSATRINQSAVEINRNASSILSSAVTINRTAQGINQEAGSILQVAQLIDRDAENINDNLNATIAFATAIKNDTGDILVQALKARQTSGCIAEKLLANGIGCSERIGQ